MAGIGQFKYDATRAKGALVFFDPRLTDEQIERALATLEQSGVIIRRTDIKGYDDRVGGPVWYIP